MLQKINTFAQNNQIWMKGGGKITHITNAIKFDSKNKSVPEALSHPGFFHDQFN